MKDLGLVGVIGRFKPPHLAGQVMLESLCERADKIVIGIGSSNRYNARNPFTAQESQEMIESFLSKRYDNYIFVHIPDFGHIPEYADGQQWKEYARVALGTLDHLVSGNDYVTALLNVDYHIIHPNTIIPQEKHIDLRSSLVRLVMARNEQWEQLVPVEVAEYITSKKLDERFRQEFGHIILTEYAQGKDVMGHENAIAEKKNVVGD